MGARDHDRAQAPAPPSGPVAGRVLDLLEGARRAAEAGAGAAALEPLAAALRLIEAHGPARVVEEAAHLLRAAPGAARACGHAPAARALAALRGEVHDALAGRARPPWRLVALIDDLRAAGNRPLLSEASLLLGAAAPALAGGTPHDLSTPGSAPAVRLRSLRAHYQRGLLLWCRGVDGTSGLGRMGDALDGLAGRADCPAQARACAHVAVAVTESLAAGRLEATEGLRRALARVDLRLRGVAGRVPGNAEDWAVSARSLAHYLALVTDAGPRAQAARAAFCLARWNPATVAGALGERLDALAAGPDPVPAGATAGLADTLALLGHGAAETALRRLEAAPAPAGPERWAALLDARDLFARRERHAAADPLAALDRARGDGAAARRLSADLDAVRAALDLRVPGRPPDRVVLAGAVAALCDTLAALGMGTAASRLALLGAPARAAARPAGDGDAALAALDAQVRALTDLTGAVGEPDAAPGRLAPDPDAAAAAGTDLDALIGLAGEAGALAGPVDDQLGVVLDAIDELGRTGARLRDQLRRLWAETEATFARAGAAGGPAPAAGGAHAEGALRDIHHSLGESASDLEGLHDTLGAAAGRVVGALDRQRALATAVRAGLAARRTAAFASLREPLERVLGEAAAAADRRAVLALRGGEQRLDARLLDALAPCLEGLVRNAVAHGVEAPAQRRRRGKAEAGTVTLALAPRGSGFELSVADDGAGLCAAALRARAQRLGLDWPARRMAACDMFWALAQPGADATPGEAAVRPGLARVGAALRAVGAGLDVHARRGRGCTVSLYLPGAPEVVDGLLVAAGTETVALPVAHVDGVARLAADEARRLRAHRGVHRFQGVPYACAALSDLLDLPPAEVEAAAPGGVPVVLLRSGRDRLALAVDAILGWREGARRTPAAPLRDLPAVLGACPGGDGRVTLVLAVPALVRRARWLRGHGRAALALTPAAAPLPTVMVVDDSLTVRHATSRLLRRNGFRAVTARDGVEALASLRAQRPSVAVLDIDMPRMDGLELATRVRADPGLADLPIIFVTSRSGPDHQARAAALGAGRYLVKPYAAADLLDSITAVL